MLNNYLLLLNRLKYKILSSISSFIKTDEHQELLAKVDHHLLLWNHDLLNLDTGQSARITSMSAENIAQAVKELLPKGEKNKQKPNVALYLDNTEFVATQYQLPGMVAQDVLAALHYQVDDLLPAYPRKLLLAVNHNETIEKNMALWLDQPRSEALFDAFKEQDLELTAIMPRIALAFLDGNTGVIKSNSLQFRETDKKGSLYVAIEKQALVKWSSITQNEMNDDDYLQHWENAQSESVNIQRINSESFYQKVDRTHPEQIRYVFFPEATRKNLKQHSRLKKGRLAIIAGIITALLLATPFIKNSIRYAKYEKKYLEHKEKTVEVRKMRATVTQFEDEWALFNDYPRVGVVAIVTKLNAIIPRNSWISVFEIDDGVVEIEGNAPNASKILEIISKQKEFEQVAFNQRTRAQRGKNNEHFGISFHLKNIDMDAYREKYLPLR